MDVDLLSRMISELVVDHDRVGLPGVGTFYADVVPSTFSDRGYTINPPYRRLSFLPNAAENDLLVNFYSEVNGIPADVAREYLTQFLSELAAVLRKRKSIMLPGLGRLRATKENNFFFVPDEKLDIYPSFRAGVRVVEDPAHDGRRKGGNPLRVQGGEGEGGRSDISRADRNSRPGQTGSACGTNDSTAFRADINCSCCRDRNNQTGRPACRSGGFCAGRLCGRRSRSCWTSRSCRNDSRSN